MLQIKNLSITHRKDLRVILDNFDLVLNRGDKAVIIGEEGNGKSTLLKWIDDPQRIEGYAHGVGERILSGERPGYLPQELPAEDAEKSVYEFFSDSDGFEAQSPGTLGRMASKFGLDPAFYYRDQPMKTLSGGEKVKAQLMRLLLDEPTLLLLDEPSNDMDLATLALLEHLIRDWDGIVLYISHDETLIERTANVVIHLEQIMRKTQCRCTVQRLPYRMYVRQREQQFAHQTQQARSERREKQLRDEKFRRIAQSVEHAQAVVSRQNPRTAALLKKKMHTVKSMERRFAREDEQMTQMPQQEEAIYFRCGENAVPAGKTVLEYRLDRLTAPDGRLLARDIELTVRGPEKLCIIGANGVGKTTLLRRIAGYLAERKDVCAAYMPQNYEELLALDALPVDFLDKSGDPAQRSWLRTCLGSLKYTAKEMEHPVRELSGGQKAKLLLLKMSLSGANVLILDEPTRNFSPMSGAVIRQMLADFPGAILSVSHDRLYMREVCRRILQLDADGLHEESADILNFLSK